MNGVEEFNCTCNAGFEGQRCEIDLCDSVTCENGPCDAGNCICDDGYVEIVNICKQTCNLNPCEVLVYTLVHSVYYNMVWNKKPTIFHRKLIELRSLNIFYIHYLENWR